LTVENGTVKALKAGVATVTAKAKDGSGKEGTIEINVIEEKVEEIKVESVTVSGKTEINVGDTETLTLEVLPSDAANKEVEWSSSDNEVLTVENGTVKALKAGVATVTAKAKDGSGNEGTIEIKVVVSFITDFDVIVNKTLYTAETFEIGFDYDTLKTANFNVSYDEEYITIKDDKYEAIKAGNTNIIVTEVNTGIEKNIDLVIVEVSEDIITEYLDNLYYELVISENVEFIPNYLDTSITFKYSTSNKNLLTNEGIYTAPILDEEIELTVEFYISDEEYAAFIPVIIKGWGTMHDVVEKYLDDVVPEQTKKNIKLPLNYYGDNTIIKWYENDVELVDGSFEFEKTTGKNYNKVIKAVIEIDGVKKSKEYTIRCMMLDTQEKVDTIFEEYNTYYDELEIDGDIDLPTYDENYGATIYWRTYNADILDVDGSFNKPFKDTVVKMMVIITAGEFEKLGFISFKTVGENLTSKLEKVESVLNRIHKEEIATQKYYLYGWESGYEKVLTKNIGYLPFLLEETKVIVDVIPNGTNLKPDRKRRSTDYITLHNTGMAHESATAKGLNEYIHTTDRQASWHFSVDDYEAYQEVPLDEVAWHAGDGSYSTGDVYFNDTYKSWSIGGGNNNSIGIEMCVYKGCDFNMVMRNTAKLVSKLLVEYNLTPSDIRQHFDFAGKDCPQVIRSANRWGEMLELIQIDYFVRTELSDVKFEFRSLTPEYLDNTGKIIKNDGSKPEIKYEVKVTMDGKVYDYTYTSVLQPI
ncbi:MAG: N-acetylmuramoyl-L-alanine amidase, partial [Acholeplasmatales bacterium]|nr:N-acetylmuramoyl-L-alanine amidase [Acholeplasmatales bacterium]